MKFKDSVRIIEFSAAVCWILYCLKRVEQENDAAIPDDGLTITSINDSDKHVVNSRHYSNEAVDVRSHNFETITKKLTFERLIIQKLNAHGIAPDKFTILFENRGTDKEHFHIQVRKGLTFNWV